MGLTFTKEIATGRAKCRLCGKKILKGSKVIHVKGYMSGGFCHVNCDPISNLLEAAKNENDNS